MSITANDISQEIDNVFKLPPKARAVDKTAPEQESSPFETFTLLDFETFRVTKEKHVPDTLPVMTIGDAKVAAPHNITPITAESKAGKTAFTGVYIAGAISRDGITDGFENVSIAPNPDGKCVLHLDTEQSEYDQQYNLKTSLIRAGISQTPEYYRAYNIRTLELKNYQLFTNKICELCDEQFKGFHSIIIDGGADFIKSVNDEAEANGIITYFVSLAVKYNCPVILIVHLNENAGRNGDTMPRGHIGRQAVRKGYCQLNITKDGDVSTLEVLRARKAGKADTPLVRYQYSKEKGYHTSVDAEIFAEEKKSKKPAPSFLEGKAAAAKIFAPPASLRHAEAVKKIMNLEGNSEDTAKRWIRNWLKWDFIQKDENGYHRLVLETIPGNHQNNEGAK